MTISPLERFELGRCFFPGKGFYCTESRSGAEAGWRARWSVGRRRASWTLALYEGLSAPPGGGTAGLLAGAQTEPFTNLEASHLRPCVREISLTVQPWLLLFAVGAVVFRFQRESMSSRSKDRNFRPGNHFDLPS